MKMANAYAFKINDNYILRCHGSVCHSEYEQLNKQINNPKELPDVLGFDEWFT
jgi:hypothetical protein